MFATFGDLRWATELIGPLQLKEDILARPLACPDLQLKVPKGSGSEIEQDEERIRNFRCDS